MRPTLKRVLAHAQRRISRAGYQVAGSPVWLLRSARCPGRWRPDTERDFWGAFPNSSARPPNQSDGRHSRALAVGIGGGRRVGKVPQDIVNLRVFQPHTLTTYLQNLCSNPPQKKDDKMRFLSLSNAAFCRNNTDDPEHRQTRSATRLRLRPPRPRFHVQW